MVANLSVEVRICFWFEKSGFLGTEMLIVLKTLLIIKNGGHAVFFGVSEQNLFFCPTVQAVHLKNQCIATIFGDQKCFQHNQHLSAQKARFFKSDANSDFNS